MFKKINNVDISVDYSVLVPPSLGGLPRMPKVKHLEKLDKRQDRRILQWSLQDHLASMREVRLADWMEQYAPQR